MTLIDLYYLAALDPTIRLHQDSPRMTIAFVFNGDRATGLTPCSLVSMTNHWMSRS